MSNYKNNINIAQVTEIALSSIATTATTISGALVGIETPYSIAAAVAATTIFGSLSKTINTKIGIKTIKISQMHIISKMFSDKSNEPCINDKKKIDKDENNELVKVYEDSKEKRDRWIFSKIRSVK